MGGGALMTPILILFFGIDPLTAVSSDLVVSLFMKPVGAAVHLRRGTVNLKLVKWLVIGSVPAAIIGVLIITSIGDSETVADIIKLALGIALLLSVATMIGKAIVSLRQYYRDRAAGIVGQSWRLGLRNHGQADPHAADRRRRWSRGGHDLGRFWVADHRWPVAALPLAASRRPGRHRPGPGRSRWSAQPR